jgi:hypothetical protein
MEQRWNDIDRGKLKDLVKNLFPCHFIYHKSHMANPDLSSEIPASICLCYGMAIGFT